MKKKSILFLFGSLLLVYFTYGAAHDDFILDTKYYPPTGVSRNVLIVFLGGSEGGMPTSNVEPFIEQGYACFKVGYFGTEHTPDHLEMIPLEYFEKAIKSLKSQPEFGNKKIVVFGGSKGGELALLLASRYQQIEGVIVRVPSSVVFQGIGGPLKTSSWSYQGDPVPFVPYYQPFDYSKVLNNQWVDLYKLSLTQTQEVEQASIAVEYINGPILILTGNEDKMWPSSQMGEMIVERLKDNNFPHRYQHVVYEDAGHSLNEKGFISGTEEGNRKARIDSEKRIFEFLRRLSEE